MNHMDPGISASTTSSSSGNSSIYGKSRRTAQSIFFSRINSSISSEYLVNARRQLLCDLDAAFGLQLSTSLIIIDPNGTGRKLLMDDVLRKYNMLAGNGKINPMIGHSSSSSQNYRNYVGIVNSELLENDSDALIDLAGQFMIRNDKREASGYSKALEDLETHFRQCRGEGRPAVIVLEGFHKFASKRQTLIYTLLDLMHKKDLLFIMIGVTGRADIQYILEKRVLSRLNAQFVYVDTPTAENIAKELYNMTILPLNNQDSDDLIDYKIQFNKHIIELFGEYSDSHMYLTRPIATLDNTVSASNDEFSLFLSQPDILSPTSQKSYVSDDVECSVENNNNDVDEGNIGLTPGKGDFSSPIRFSQRASAKKQRDTFSNSNNISSSSKKKKIKHTQDTPKHTLISSDALNINEYIKKQAELPTTTTNKNSSNDDNMRNISVLLKAGCLLRTIRVYKEWGYGIDDFSRTVQFAIMGLTDAAPFLSKEKFELSMAQQMPFTVAESMSTLDEVELYLLAAMCYLHLHETTADHFTVAALINNYDRMTSNVKDKRILKLQLVSAINSLCNKKFIQLFNNHSGVKCANQTGVSSITNQTIVFLTASVHEIKKAFLNKQLKNNTASSSIECRRPQPLIRIQERIRQLLENPTKPNNYSMDSSSVLQSIL